MLDLRLFCIYNMHDNEKAIQREVISMAKQIKKVVLAYSGGLDTSIIIPWLKENYDGCEVIAVSGDVGQGTELDGLEEKAKKTGASKLYVLDLKKDFVENYIFPTMQAGAVYEDKYLLGTSFARPVIAKAIVDIAKKEGADAICHGCTGKGNDQVRFELTIKAFAPEMTIIAPWRIWNIKSREEEIEYAEAHNIPLKINRETNYSKDKNLWHLSHEGLDLEDPSNEPQYEKEGFLELGVSPLQAPDKPTYITLHFEKGIPTALNGEAIDSVSLIEALNKIGGENGVGLADLVENRLVGMKSRGPSRDHHARQGDPALQAARRRQVRRDGVRRPVVHALARSALRVRFQDAGDGHGRRQAPHLQGQRHECGHHIPVLPLQRGHRDLRRRRRRLLPEGFRGLHQPLRPAPQGQGDAR